MQILHIVKPSNWKMGNYISTCTNMDFGQGYNVGIQNAKIEFFFFNYEPRKKKLKSENKLQKKNNIYRLHLSSNYTQITFYSLIKSPQK